MKKVLSFILLLMLTLGLLAGCGSDGSGSENGNENPDENTEQQASEEAAFPLTVTDALDYDITIDEKPERIVSLIPSNTEIAFALGLGEEIVGVSDNDNYPEEVEEKERVGGMELNVEAIIGLEPDLVLAHASGAHNSEAALKQIRDAGINVFVVHDAQDIESVYESIEQIAQVTGTQEKAEEIVSNMKDEFAALSEKTEAISDDERQSVFFEVAPAPEIYTAGKNTFFQDLLGIVNADNAAQEQDGWVQIDPEAIVELNPDVIITTYGHYVDNPVEQVTNRDGWGDMTAVANEQVYDVHSDLVSRPGPRLVEGAKEIAEVVYPELFEE
ncbi:ABC transporter substrate-binding protein [Lentibacillus sp. CBA3610]|uniref:ABC transporter substrate-binding protein n=1 Tax=Lentibacillus sp. CBA3610 TaxID=2518176 RepID=UPI0015961356|nr:ABC transporter substrate-binding protein [Lentibacillus sp. CBA3610]QKY68690.1 ABC transporter substrate-binding protein [Lentibacillus sp. CBA3610]